MKYACNNFGECMGRHENPSNNSTNNRTLINLLGSVGLNGRNLREEVVKIQDALNRVGPLKGGPVVPLIVDGFVGPKTVKAIQDFQRAQFPGKIADGRVDPGQRTVGRLNELLIGASAFNNGMAPAFAATAAPGGFGFQGNRHGLVQATTVPVLPMGTVTSDAQMSLADRHAEDAEKRLTAAIKRMNQAVTAMSKKVKTEKEKELIREINWHFKASKDTDPTKHMLKVSTVLATMLTAVKEHNLGTRSIFKKGTSSDPSTIAYAALGGWNSTVQDDRHIVITPKFVTQISLVIVHELAHFCGGLPSSGRQIVHRSSPDPFPTGTKKEDGTKNYRDMEPFDARTNVYSYTVYCYPERAEFKVPPGV